MTSSVNLIGRGAIFTRAAGRPHPPINNAAQRKQGKERNHEELKERDEGRERKREEERKGKQGRCSWIERGREERMDAME